jgi:predicted Zn finger-like uncharacterized protein
MTSIWNSSAGSDAECKECGAIYKVTVTRLPVKDGDSFKCEICGSTMRTWSSTLVPSFELKAPGKKPAD